MEAVEVVGEEEEKKDPTLDLDLNMHCSLKDLQLRKVRQLINKYRLINFTITDRSFTCE